MKIYIFVPTAITHLLHSLHPCIHELNISTTTASTNNFVSALFSVPTRAPNGVRVTSFEFTSDLLVQWNPLSQDYANGKFLGYTIYYRETSAFWSTPDEKVNTSSHYSTRFTLKDLKPGHRYRVRVAAFTSKGVGPPSYYEYVTTGMFLADLLLA